MKKEIIKKNGAQVIYKRENGSIGVMTINDEKTMTQQQFKDEVDVNNLMEKYITTGNAQIFQRSGKGVYGDFSEVKDFQSSLHSIMEAEQAFMQLPARTRAKFDNDPHKMFEFLNNKSNEAEALELGLIEKKSEPPAPPAPPKAEPKQ